MRYSRELGIAHTLLAVGLIFPALTIAERYNPPGLCAIVNNTAYESLTLPIPIAAEYPGGSTQTLTILVGDTEQAGNPQAGTGDTEFVSVLLDTDADGTPEPFTASSCTYNQSAAPPGCSVIQNLNLPVVTEDTTYRGRVLMSYGSLDPANGCGNNGFGDSEDFTLVVDVQELITIEDVTVSEDTGVINLEATLSHDVKDASGFVSFTVDYVLTDGSATVADSDYVATGGTLSFSGMAGETVSISVTSIADIVPEGDETFTVSLTNLTNTTHGIDISDTATVTLEEDDTEVSLTLEKTVSDTTPNIGDLVTFEIKVLNAGPDDAIDASVTDQVPAGLTSITPVVVPGASTMTVTGNTIDWMGIDVPANGSSIATYSVVVLAP